MIPLQKKYPTIGCCGLDCGLCPRYYTEGKSRCPGCGGPGFYDKHPSCGYITCCVKKKEIEVCAECDEFLCKRFESWLGKNIIHDSFLTHQKIAGNLQFIKTYGLKKFLDQQKCRIELLEILLRGFNDGRNRSFFCIATTLLEITDLETAIRKAKKRISTNHIKPDNSKARAGIIKSSLNEFAANREIELKLFKKK